MKHEQGFTLVEVLVSVALVGVIATAFLGAMSSNIKATSVAGNRTTADTIARGHMESIMGQAYSTTAWSYEVTTSQRTATQAPSWWDASSPPLLDSTYEGYRVEARAEDFDADGDGTLEVPGDDEGIRRITVEVYSDGADPVLTLENYKVDV
jgi:prepilin-type N-terminal cleavage/methylation domain-containing protein